MQIDVGQVIVWVILGSLAGTLASMLFYRARSRFQDIGNIVVGMLGAIIGGALFGALGINFNLPTLTFSLDDLIAAFVGSLILLLVIRLLRR